MSETPTPDTHDHGHSHGGHGHDHGHGHAHGGHDHGHGHDQAGVDYSKYAHSHSHGDGHEHHEIELPKQLHFLIHLADFYGPRTSALISTAFVSAASLIICMNIFILDKIGLLSEKNLVIMTAFAAGTLLGDAVLHILPSMPEGNIFKILVGVGILAFYILEKLISAGHGHGHSHGGEKKGTQKKPAQPEKPEGISANALLNIAADFFHNFLDGIAVGITYMIGSKQGVTSTIAVFIHELPHEIGDFAVLLKGGFTISKAYMM